MLRVNMYTTILFLKLLAVFDLQLIADPSIVAVNKTVTLFMTKVCNHFIMHMYVKH